jgi:hypothetical protein
MGDDGLWEQDTACCSADIGKSDKLISRHEQCRLLGMLRRVALVRTDVSEELSSSFISVTRIGELGTTLAITSNRRSVRRLLVIASVVPSSTASVV